VLLRDLTLSTSLGQCDRGRIQVFPWQSAFLEELLPAVVHLLLCVEALSGRSRVKFGFLQVFG
jgi:hypothetical protein